MSSFCGIWTQDREICRSGSVCTSVGSPGHYSLEKFPGKWHSRPAGWYLNRAIQAPL